MSLLEEKCRQFKRVVLLLSKAEQSNYTQQQQQQHQHKSRLLL